MKGKMLGLLIRFGIFVVITVGLTVWIGAQIAKLNFDDRYELTATFDDVTGLFNGDDVKLSGVPVGKVTGIHIDDGRADVTFEVDETVVLPVDTVVAVRWRNLIGQRYVYLYPGSAADTLKDGSEVDATKSVVDLGDLVNSLGPLAQAIDPEELNAIFTALLEALDGNETNVDGLIANLDSVLAMLADRDATIRQLVSDYETVTGALSRRDQQIQTMVDNLVLLSQTFADNSTVLDQALVELSGFAVNLDTVLSENADDLGRILANLGLLTDTVVAHLDELEGIFERTPTALLELFGTVDRGEFIKINVACAWINHATPNPPNYGCPHPLILPGSGQLGLSTPGDFQALLVGEG